MHLIASAPGRRESCYATAMQCVMWVHLQQLTVAWNQKDRQTCSLQYFAPLLWAKVITNSINVNNWQKAKACTPAALVNSAIRLANGIRLPHSVGPGFSSISLIYAEKTLREANVMCIAFTVITHYFTLTPESLYYTFTTYPLNTSTLPTYLKSHYICSYTVHAVFFNWPLF